MKWPWNKSHTEEVRRARAIREDVEAQQPEVDKVVESLQSRYESNHLAWMIAQAIRSNSRG